MLPDEVSGGQKHNNAHDREEDLEEDGVFIYPQYPTVEGLLIADEAEGGAHDRHQPHHTQIGQIALLILGQEEVYRQNQEGHSSHEKLGDKEGEVYIHIAWPILSRRGVTPLSMIRVKG